jgi:hypothetical protein
VDCDLRDGMVLASGITDTGKVVSPVVHRETIGFLASDLSKAFYAKHQTPVAHLDQTWGKLLRVQDADDGMQYRIYAVKDAFSDFRFRKFVVKDGFVIASRLSPEPGFKTESAKGDYKGIEINEISHLYYKNHPMSLESVETVWGAPVLIQKTDNRLEKRTYKLQMPTDAAFAFRFFIIESGMVVSSGVSDTMDVDTK